MLPSEIYYDAMLATDEALQAWGGGVSVSSIMLSDLEMVNMKVIAAALID